MNLISYDLLAGIASQIPSFYYIILYIQSST